MPEHRKGFTTIALEKTLARDIKRAKIHPSQSDNEILKLIFSGYKKNGRKNLTGGKS